MMKTFMITYTVDRGLTKETKLMSAETYTKAYVNAECDLPEGTIILEITEIK